MTGRRLTRWVCGFVLCAVLASLRIPWREADSGNSAFWAYAFFSDDEANYTAGGRLAVLTGKFLDPELNEPHTFGGSWGMHLLGYLGYRFGGLSLAAARWPSMLLAIAAWLTVYAVASRRTLPLLAGIVVLVLSCNPASLTYERAASTDVVVGALAVLAFALMTARPAAWAAGAGALMAAACTVKANACVLLPLIVLAGVGSSRKRGQRLVAWAAAFAVTLTLLWWGRHLAGDAAALEACSRWQYSLLDLHYNPRDWLKPLSVFPRWQNSMMLGPFLVWALALPAWWLLQFWNRRGRWWSSRHALPAGLLIYAAALALQPNNSLRHYLPLFFFVPILLTQSRWLFQRADIAFDARRAALLVCAIALLFALYWFQRDRGWSAEKVHAVAYNDVTVPHGAWAYSGGRIFFGWLATSAAAAAAIAGEARRGWLTAALVSLVLVWLFFANYTISLLSIPSDFVINQLLLQLSLVAAGIAILTTPVALRRWQNWYLVHACLLAAFIVGNSCWSQAYRELGVRTFYTRDAARALAETLPPDALVIGRRSPTLLRDTTVRVGMSIIYPPEQFVQKLANLFAENPRRPVFWLVDGDDDLQWQTSHELVEKRWHISYITTVQVPSGDLLHMRYVPEKLPLVRIHLMRLRT